jgi:dCMP deaminase
MSTAVTPLAGLEEQIARQTKWDNAYIEMAQWVAQKFSKDRSTKMGCVIVGPGLEVRSIGYNGFPRGVNDNIEARHARPAKYLWTEHAERNAIYNAARGHTELDGCTAYVPWFPCMDCARGLVQSGITTVVAFKPNFDDPKWGEDFKNTVILLGEAGVTVRYAEGSVIRS